MKRLTPILLMLMLCISVPGFSQMVEHVVDKGETFASIAQKYGMTEKQLKEANPKYKGVFFAGMTLNIPQKYVNASSATPQAQPSPEPQQETNTPKQYEVPNHTSSTQQAPVSRHKYYEGDTDEEGRPDGYGTMYFEPKYGNIAYTERLEGTWKKGVPVSGKAYRNFKSNGMPRLKFEGEFKQKKKGILNYLEDLYLKGDVVFYSYNEDSQYPTRGNQVYWGYNDGHQIKNGYYLATKTKQVGYIRNGKYGNLGKHGVLTPEAKKYYDEVSPLGSAWLLERKATFRHSIVADKVDSFHKFDNIYWSGPTKDGLLDGKGEGFFTLKDDKLTIGYTVEGEFKDGVPVKVTIHRDHFYDSGSVYNNIQDHSALILTMGELQNNERSFSIESLTHKNDRCDISYSGFVDSNFQFKEDYAQAEKNRVSEKEWEAIRKLTAVVAVGMGAAMEVAKFLPSSGSGSSSSYSSSSRDEESSSDSSSSDTEETYSCRVHLTFSDGKPVYEGSGIAYFKGILNTSRQRYETDDKGYATITWPKSKGKVIDTLTLDRKIMFHDVHTVDELNLVDGGRYEICMDCK